MFYLALYWILLLDKLRTAVEKLCPKPYGRRKHEERNGDCNFRDIKASHGSELKHSTSAGPDVGGLAGVSEYGEAPRI